MSEMVETPEIFKHGSAWLKADFHLHTRADKEFKYDGEENSFVSGYVASLKAAGIQLGVITNHNKFDINEFKALRKKARKEEIFLLPGVELSVNDGSNGIHTLIVFSDQWIENGNDYINPFLTVVFEGKTPGRYENENARTSFGLIDTIKKLEGYHRDFFIVFAHVEQNGGLWKELDGGRFQEIGRNENFRKRTLGFQKVETHDVQDRVCRLKVQRWLDGLYPAEVEGSDNKSVKDIGKGKNCYIKIGAFSFDAVRFALMDHRNRCSKELKDYTHSYIKNIRFTGGTLSGRELYFSPELNTLIGIRGSGKSSILEVIRYALDIPFGEKANDMKYKEGLIHFTLGSGGKVEIDAIDRYGQPYVIRRVTKEKYSEVLVDGKLQPGVSIRETVINKPIYFGQKDLSTTGEGFEKDLVDKLLGSKLDEIRRKIDIQKIKAGEAVNRLAKIASVDEQIKEQKDIIEDTKHRLKIYARHGIEEKLQKRLDFENDSRAMKKGIELTGNFIADLQDLLAKHEDDIKNFIGYTSKHNQGLFEKFYADFAITVQAVDQIKTGLESLSNKRENLLGRQAELNTIRKGMVDEFAEIERKLAEELKDSGNRNISSDEFLNLKKKLNTANQLLVEVSRQSDQKKALKDMLFTELQKLNDLWLEEFHLIKKELDKVGTDGRALSIISGYKEDKPAYLAFMKDVFKGSNIRESTYRNIVKQYQDFIAIYKDFDNAKNYFGSNPQVLTEMFRGNLKALLIYQVPNKFTIHYRGKELKHHSLGQRASALILFVLSQNENDMIIIDQPEDDLDNQTIYEDVIKLIRKMKKEVQFIFATHNPNIPVLGDAEQVQSCSFVDDTVSVQSGSVDHPDTQKTIVDIMEGGQEAFNRRKEIYRIWKP